jgi:hypothetical protein
MESPLALVDQNSRQGDTWLQNVSFGIGWNGNRGRKWIIWGCWDCACSVKWNFAPRPPSACVIWYEGALFMRRRGAGHVQSKQTGQTWALEETKDHGGSSRYSGGEPRVWPKKENSKNFYVMWLQCMIMHLKALDRSTIYCTLLIFKLQYTHTLWLFLSLPLLHSDGGVTHCHQCTCKASPLKPNLKTPVRAAGVQL